MEYAVIGLGRFGSAVAMELEKKGNTVIAIDKDPKKCKDISKHVSTTLILDATNEEAIREASLDHVDVVIVGMGTTGVMLRF